MANKSNKLLRVISLPHSPHCSSTLTAREVVSIPVCTKQALWQVYFSQKEMCHSWPSSPRSSCEWRWSLVWLGCFRLGRETLHCPWHRPGPAAGWGALSILALEGASRLFFLFTEILALLPLSSNMYFFSLSGDLQFSRLHSFLRGGELQWHFILGGAQLSNLPLPPVTMVAVRQRTVTYCSFQWAGDAAVPSLQSSP